MARTGRPTRRIDATRPFANIASDLVALRVSAGLTVTQLAREAKFSTAVISTATAGLRMPTADVLEAYVRGCGANKHAVARWLTRRTTELSAAAAPAGQVAPSASAALTVVEPGPPRPAEAKSASPPAATPVLAGNVVDLPGRADYDTGPHRGRRFSPDDPASVTTLLELANALNVLRRQHSYADLQRAAERAPRHRRLARATISDLLNGKSVPTRETAIAFLTACGLSGEQQRPWLAAWERVATEHLYRPGRAVRVVEARTRDLGLQERPLAEVDAGRDLPVLPPYVARDLDVALREVLAAASVSGGCCY